MDWTRIGGCDGLTDCRQPSIEADKRLLSLKHGVILGGCGS
jgi:hypothetical protein